MHKYATMLDRIRANSVDSETQLFDGTPCWNWTGATNGNYYPSIRVRWKKGPKRGKVRSALAHRISLEAKIGRELRKNEMACHLCNNKKCVNPEHLAAGTQRQNIRQCVNDGRHKTPFAAPGSPNYAGGEDCRPATAEEVEAAGW